MSSCQALLAIIMSITVNDMILCAGCVSVKEARALSDAIDGSDGASWHLPLPPLTATSLEPYSPGEHSSTTIYLWSAGYQC